MRAALLLALAVLAAGCLGEDAAAVDDAPLVEDASADAVAPASVAATAPLVENGTATYAVVLDGRTPLRACVPDGPGTCRGMSLPGSDASAFTASGLAARPLAADVTLTWSASGPHTAFLTLGIVAMTSCGGDCRNAAYVARVTGESPLALKLDAIEWPEEAALYWGVSAPCLSAGPAYACGGAEQDYHLEGTVTVEGP